jgi:GDPmannose 4,6-dehydratase
VARDWGYAKDYADGMWRILQQDEARDYVLATGRSTTVRGFAERAAAALGMHLQWSGAGASEIGVDRNGGRAVIEVSPALFRPAELAVTVGDASRARAVLGWKPSVDIEGLISIMVEADERRVLENRPLE